MPITALQLATNLSISLQKLVTGFNPIKQGPTRIDFDLSLIDLTVYTQAYAGILSLNNSAATIDLQSFTNLAGEAVTLTKALAMVVTVSGPSGVVKITPGASNGLAAWFFGSTDGIVLRDGDSFAFQRNPAKTAVVVDATHKTITVTETATHPVTVTIAIIGGP